MDKVKNNSLYEIKNAVFGSRFILAVAGSVLALAAASWDMIVSVYKQPALLVGGFHDSLFFSSSVSSLFLMFAPLICTIPYASSFVDEFRSGYIKPYLIRTTKKQYVKNKVISIAISGGLSLSAGAVSFYIVSVLILKFIEPVNEAYTFNFIAMFSRIFLLFLFGVIFSLIGGLVSAFLMSRYVAYIVPFISYYLLIILCERYFKSVYSINPQEWIMQGGYWLGGIWGLILFLLEIIGIFSLLLVLIMYKRIKEH